MRSQDATNNLHMENWRLQGLPNLIICKALPQA